MDQHRRKPAEGSSTRASSSAENLTAAKPVTMDLVEPARLRPSVRRNTATVAKGVIRDTGTVVPVTLALLDSTGSMTMPNVARVHWHAKPDPRQHSLSQATAATTRKPSGRATWPRGRTITTCRCCVREQGGGQRVVADACHVHRAVFPVVGRLIRRVYVALSGYTEPQGRSAEKHAGGRRRWPLPMTPATKRADLRSMCRGTDEQGQYVRSGARQIKRQGPRWPAPNPNGTGIRTLRLRPESALAVKSFAVTAIEELGRRGKGRRIAGSHQDGAAIRRCAYQGRGYEGGKLWAADGAKV